MQEDDGIFVFCSEYSDVLTFSAGAGPPSVPKPPSLQEVGVRHLTLSWEPPESNGAEITSYTLEMENPESVRSAICGRILFKHTHTQKFSYYCVEIMHIVWNQFYSEV